MSDVIIYDRMQMRRGTAANLASANEVLREGEICVETDTGRFKIGDGATAYNSLPYANVSINSDAPADGDVLTYDATFGLWRPESGGSGGSIDPSLQIDRTEDWFKGRTTSTNATTNFVTDNALPVVYLGSGSIGSATVNVDAAGQSYLTLATVGTGGSARAVLGNGAKIMVGGGEIRLTAAVKLPTLSTATDRFQLAVGLRDAITGVTKYLEAVYQDNINSGKWRLRSLDAASTDVDTATVGPVAGVWTTVELVINAAGTSVELLIDNVSQATLTTNIPTTALAFFVSCGKLAGSSNRTCDLRYMRFRQTFTTPR